MFENEAKEAAEKAAKEVADAKAEAATAKAEADALKVEKEKLESEYKKLKGKDMNFRRLEQMTQEERDALTDKETELQKRQEALEDQQQSHIKALHDDWRSAAIEKASRGDAEKAKAIQAALDDLKGEETDRASIESRVAKAAKLARKDDPTDRVGSVFSFNGYSPEKPKEKSFADTDEGTELARRMGLSYVKAKK